MEDEVTSRATATFRRCEELRQRAGLSVDDLVLKCGGRPARSSILRLERGFAIRTHNAFRVATEIRRRLEEINADLFDIEAEVVRQ